MQNRNNPPAWARPAQIVSLYAFAVLILSLAADLVALAAVWLMSRYYIWQRGDPGWSENRFYYYAVIIFVVEIMMAISHYLAASAMQKHVSGRLRTVCLSVGTLLVCGWVYYIVPNDLFGSRWLAVLPVALAHFGGGIFGFTQKPEENRLRSLPVLDQIFRA